MSGLFVVGGIYVREGLLLLARRPAGGPHGGLWELPGGKVEPGESPTAALAREWREELGVEVLGAEPETFAVEERTSGPLTLLFFRVLGLAGEPRPIHGEALRWSAAEEALLLATPPADAPVLRRLLRDGGGRFVTTERASDEERRVLARELDPHIPGSDSLAPGRTVGFRKRLPGRPALLEGILVSTSDGPRAFVNLCPHVPVPLDRPDEELLASDGRHLVCARHGALFLATSGLCVAGPCEGDSLTPLPIVPSGTGWALVRP